MAMRWPRKVAGIPESSVQTQITTAYRAFRITVNDMSQGRATRQPSGIPDLLCWHIESQRVWFLEVKRPYVRGAHPFGKRSWEQEQWHREARAAGIAVATTDSVEEALAYAAFLGVPLPAGAFRRLFDPEQQARFYDPRALPRVTRRVKARSR